METNNNEREFFTLTDEDGNEIRFELIGATEYKGKNYYAMIPAEDDQAQEESDGFCEYVILREEKDEDGEYPLAKIIAEFVLKNICSKKGRAICLFSLFFI